MKREFVTGVRYLVTLVRSSLLAGIINLTKEDHRLVELWVKRYFQCDCPTTSMPPRCSKGKRRRCNLLAPESQPQPSNEGNSYNQTFSGKFCRCGKDYNPETESEAMLSCMICEVDYLPPPFYANLTCSGLVSRELPQPPHRGYEPAAS